MFRSQRIYVIQLVNIEELLVITKMIRHLFLLDSKIKIQTETLEAVYITAIRGA